MRHTMIRMQRHKDLSQSAPHSKEKETTYKGDQNEGHEMHGTAD